MMMDILLCGLSASLSSVIGKKLHVIFLLFHNEGRHSFFQWVTSNFPPWLMSLCLCSLLSQFQLRRTPTCSSDSIKSSEKLFVSCFAYTVRGFLPVRHFWAACDCDIKHVYVTLQAHVSQIVQTSMALTEKPPGSRLLNNTTLIYSAGVGESCSAHAKIGKSESSFRFLLSIIYSYSHSPGKSLASVPGSRVVRRRKQCLECEEREKKTWVIPTCQPLAQFLLLLLLFPKCVAFTFSSCSQVLRLICSSKPVFLPLKILFKGSFSFKVRLLYTHQNTLSFTTPNKQHKQTWLPSVQPVIKNISRNLPLLVFLYGFSF